MAWSWSTATTSGMPSNSQRRTKKLSPCGLSPSATPLSRCAATACRPHPINLVFQTDRAAGKTRTQADELSRNQNGSQARLPLRRCLQQVSVPAADGAKQDSNCCRHPTSM